MVSKRGDVEDAGIEGGRVERGDWGEVVGNDWGHDGSRFSQRLMKKQDRMLIEGDWYLRGEKIGDEDMGGR